MTALLNLIARLLFAVAFVVLLFGLLTLGLAVGLVLWIVALLTGRRRQAPQVWVSRMRKQAEAMRPGRPGRATQRGNGEVVDAEVREIR